MTKLKFLFELRDRLEGLPYDEVEERLNFYSEMIEDRMEEGLSEEEAAKAKKSELADKSRAEFSKLEHGDEENLKLWRWFVDVSLWNIRKRISCSE